MDHENAQTTVPTGVIDLGVGDPAFELLPLERLDRAAQSFFRRGERGALQYGAERGDAGLRRALAGLLTPGYGYPVDPDSLLITNGASQGLDLICTLHTHPGQVIFVEEPSYFLALRIFQDHGLRPVAIPVDAAGLQIEALEAALQQHRPRLLYTIPAFQNPSGGTLAAERRRRLVELAQEYDFLIVADEVYHLLSYGAPPPPALFSYAQEAEVLSLGSFSKILAPGLRLGWMHTHPATINRLAGCGLLDSGGGLNPFTSAIVRPLVESGELAGNIAHLKTVYAARRDALDAALRHDLPGAAYRKPGGGFFFWVQLPNGLDAAAYLPRARECQVGYRPGGRFSSQGGLRDWVRLGFSFYDEARLSEGVRRLAQVFDPAAGITLPTTSPTPAP